MKTKLIAIAAITMGFAATNVKADNFLDPCITAHSDFTAQKNTILASYNSRLAQVESLSLPDNYRILWIKEKKQDMRPYYDNKVVPGANSLGMEAPPFDKWFNGQIDNAGGNKLILSHFHEEMKRLIVSERATSDASLQRAKRELESSCKMDPGNQALRVATKVLIEGIKSPIMVPVAAVKIIDRNIKGAARESGELDKVLKGTTGISVKDIKKHGIFGGPNSIFRKPFG